MNTSSLHKAQSALAAEKTISCLRRYLAGLGRALVLATILVLGFREPLHGQSMSMAGTLQESSRNIGSYDMKTQKVENSLWKVTASFEKTTSDNPYKGQYTYTIGKVGERHVFDWQAAMNPIDNHHVPDAKFSNRGGQYTYPAIGSLGQRLEDCSGGMEVKLEGVFEMIFHSFEMTNRVISAIQNISLAGQRVTIYKVEYRLVHRIALGENPLRKTTLSVVEWMNPELGIVSRSWVGESHFSDSGKSVSESGAFLLPSIK